VWRKMERQNDLVIDICRYFVAQEVACSKNAETVLCFFITESESGLNRKVPPDLGSNLRRKPPKISNGAGYN
jgi:hypothetical protein